MTRLPAVESGEALPVQFTSSEDLTGAAVMGWISVNGGAAVSQTGSLDAGGKTGYVPFPGSLMVVDSTGKAGSYAGEIVFTLAGAIWSPRVEQFSGVIIKSVRP